MARNLLLGKGHALTSPFDRKRGGRKKTHHPYTFEKAKERLTPQIEKAAVRAGALAADACPKGNAVVSITLNSEYLAKTHMPTALAATIGARLVGSRARKGARAKDECPELLYSAPVKQLKLLPQWMNKIKADTDVAHDFRKIEDVRIETAADKIHPTRSAKKHAWEIVLHASANPRDKYILDDFLQFCERRLKSAIKVDADRRIFAGGLCFLPAIADAASIEAVLEFTYARWARIMPRLRRTKIELGGRKTIECEVPNMAPLDQTSRLLIIDGGRPAAASFLTHLVKDIEYPGLGPPVPDYQDHCLGVLSAALFGQCNSGKLRQPVCRVDCARVFDNRSWADPNFEYFDVLVRVRNLLKDGGDKYDFACLCCGPEVAIEDGEPSAWTAVLDQVCGEIKTQLFSAAGNGGGLDRAAGLARIQPPSDGVNITSVGSCASVAGRPKKWTRATYSSIGRGRRPGIVKPDFLAGGGELPHDPFYVLGPASGTAIPKIGTSLAAPNAARIATAIRASLGDHISPLGIKALMINRADRRKKSCIEVGWGRITESAFALTETAANEVVVVYEGPLYPNEHREVPIPLPDGEFPGKVQIAATFCVVTQTDPHHPLNYTRAGLEVIYRPHAEKFEIDENGKKSKRPARDDFFVPKKMFQLEGVLRREGYKWESVMHRARAPKWSSLLRPVFDVCYLTREESEDASDPKPIRYALVIRLTSRTVKDLYNRVFRKYRRQLVPMEPVLHLPVSV
jgi:Subtilase family